MRRSKVKADNRAETRGGGWVGLPHVVVDSPAYLHLSLWGRAVLVEIARGFNGWNNGKIAISFDQLCARLNNSNRRKLSQALAELIEHGLIAVEAEGQWKPRLAREYRLTFVSSGDVCHPRRATNEYLDWKPTRFSSSDDASPERRVSGNTASPEPLNAGNTSSPARFAKPRKTAISEGSPSAGSGDDALLLISSHPPPQKRGPRLRGETDHVEPQKHGGPKSALPGVKPETLAMAQHLRAVA